MKYLKQFNSTNENKIYLNPKRIPSLKYDIEVILSDMIDDGFEITTNIRSYYSNIELRIGNIDWLDPGYFQTTLEKYSNSLYHFIDYIKDEGFKIDYMDLTFKSGKDDNYKISLKNANTNMIDNILLSHKYKILNKLEISIYPIK